MNGLIEVTCEERPRGGVRGEVRMRGHPRSGAAEVAQRSKHCFNVRTSTGELTTSAISPTQAAPAAYKWFPTHPTTASVGRCTGN